MLQTVRIYCVLMIVGKALLSCTGSSTESASGNAQQMDSTFSSVPLCGSVANLTAIADLPAPQKTDRIGNAHLRITTSSDQAQVWFDQGLNHLHGFWHLEAYRAFKEVIKLDSNCAMGYWGVAMCAPGFNGTEPVWKQSINKANELKSSVSGLESALIEASTVLINEGLGANAVQKFRALYQKYPTEPEAIAFAAIILRQHQNQITQQEVKTLLEKALQRFPDNVALMHYYIHVMELRPEFAQAKGIAKKMSKIAPNAPHLTHMPGHLYYLAGDYDKAIEVYEAARKLEKAYHTTTNIPYISNQNYIHNLQFLAVAQAEISYEAALKTANELANISLKTTLQNEGANMIYAYEGRILPALVHLRYRHYQKAVEYFDQVLNSLDNPIRNPLVKLYFQAMREYAKGMNGLLIASASRPDGGASAGMALTAYMRQFEQLGMQYQNSPEFKSINETYDIMSMARYELAGWIDNLDPTWPFNDTAWKEAISLQNSIAYDEPPRLMYPIEESLARLHRYRKENALAKNAIAQALKRRPQSPLLQHLMTSI